MSKSKFDVLEAIFTGTITGLGILGAAAALSREKKFEALQLTLDAEQRRRKFRPMGREFGKILEAVQDEYTDSNRMRVVKIIARGDRGITARQVSQLLEEFCLESNKFAAFRELAPRITNPAAMVPHLEDHFYFSHCRQAKELLLH